MIGEKIKFLHTFKAHHHIVFYVKFYNRIQNFKSIGRKIKRLNVHSKQHSTAQDARPYILTLKGSGYGPMMVMVGHDDDDDDNSCSIRDL